MQTLWGLLFRLVDCRAFHMSGRTASVFDIGGSHLRHHFIAMDNVFLVLSIALVS